MHVQVTDDQPTIAGRNGLTGLWHLNHRNWLSSQNLKGNPNGERRLCTSRDKRCKLVRIRTVAFMQSGHYAVILHTHQQHATPRIGQANDRLQKFSIRERASIALEFHLKTFTLTNQFP